MALDRDSLCNSITPSVLHIGAKYMRVTSKGQVTIPLEVREDLGIRPAETEIEFVKDKNGHWYLKKTRSKTSVSRFRSAHNTGKLRMSTDDIMKLTRGHRPE